MSHLWSYVGYGYSYRCLIEVCLDWQIYGTCYLVMVSLNIGLAMLVTVIVIDVSFVELCLDWQIYGTCYWVNLDWYICILLMIQVSLSVIYFMR